MASSCGVRDRYFGQLTGGMIVGGLSDVVSVGGKLVEFGGKSEWLKPLEELGEKWSAISKELENLAEAPKFETAEGLVDYLKGKYKNSLVIDAFKSLDLESLHKDLGKIFKLYEDIPGEVKQLLTPVSKAGNIDLPIAKISEKKAGTSGEARFHLTLSAESSAACETGAKWPVKDDKITPGLVRLNLSGQIVAGAGGKLPFSGGSAGASASAGVSAEFSIFHRPQVPERLLASQLVRRIPALPNPFDLGSMWQAMEGGDLQGLIMQLGGYAEAKANISVGKAFDLPAVLSGKIEIVAEVSFKRKAAYTITALSTKNNELLVSLSRDKKSVTAWSLGLGLELDIAPLVGRIHGEMTEALGDWSEGLEEIKPYLTPGTFIQKNLTKELGELAEILVKDDSLRKGLAEDLGILLGTTGSDESALIGQLEKKLVDKLNFVAGLAKSKADDVEAKAGEVVDAITAALPTLVQDHAQSILKKKTAELISKFRGKLDMKIKDILSGANGHAKPAAKDIGKALKSLGVKVDKTIKTIDDAAAGIRQLVNEFDSLLRKIVAVVEKAGKEKIGAQLSLEESRTSGMEVEVVGTFSNCDPAASSAYSALVRGKLSGMQDLIQGANVNGFIIDKDKSSIRHFTKVSSKIGYAFVGLGIELKGHQLLTSEAAITVRGNGDVAVSSKGEIEKAKYGPREGREVSLFSTYNLLLAKAENDDGVGRDKSLQKAISLGLTASHLDKDLKASEVTGFLKRLSDNGLIHADRLAQAEKTYQKWLEDAGEDSNLLAGDITVELGLGADDLQNMINWGEAIVAELNSTDNMNETAACFELATDAVLASGRVTPSEFKRVLKDRRASGDRNRHPEISDRDWLHGKVQFARRKGKLSTQKHHKYVKTVDAYDESPGKSRAVNIPMISMNALGDILQLMYEIYSANPRVEKGGEGWDKGDYAKAEERLIKSSERWMDLGGKFFSFRTEMGDRTLSFLVVLVALSKGASLKRVASGLLGDEMIRITMTPRFGPKAKQIPVKI